MMTFDQSELEEAAESISNLLSTHWARIQETISSSDEKTNVSLSLSLDHSGKVRIVKAKISYSLRTRDETEAQVCDPDQIQLI